MMLLIRKLFGLKTYTFRHQRGAECTIYARSQDSARKQMRSFLRETMYGPWALFYDPEAVEREFKQCELIEPKTNKPSEV